MLLNINQLSIILGCSTKTIRRLIQRGEIHAKKIGRVLRIAPKELIKWFGSIDEVNQAIQEMRKGGKQ
ncbi:MAG: helix-turn-helix domain-containing protein [Bifidobacteriaceae bacterium]|jgi:excisionase family DNA binding protein|nr:helix-turn-helix domain-containing protein [Bifidobacteriaceae bacterium]